LHFTFYFLLFTFSFLLFPFVFFLLSFIFCLLSFYKGLTWFRQQDEVVCKHAECGNAALKTVLQLFTNGEDNFALAA